MEAYFLDNAGNQQLAKIKIIPGVFVGINTFDESNNHTGYIYIHFHLNNRLFLDTIYCYNEFRGNGIAYFINELAEYVLRDYQGYVVRGAFEPTQMSTDRINKITRDNEELKEMAYRFYQKSGYQVISYDDYIRTQTAYPDISPGDFQLGEDLSKIIVAKKIERSEYPFYEQDGNIYHVNMKDIIVKKL